jgi:hypothetical protein
MYEIPTDKRLADLFLVRTCQVFFRPVLLDLYLAQAPAPWGLKDSVHHACFAVAWPLLQMWHSLALCPRTCRRCYLTRLSRHVARKYLRESELSTGVDRLSTSVRPVQVHAADYQLARALIENCSSLRLLGNPSPDAWWPSVSSLLFSRFRILRFDSFPKEIGSWPVKLLDDKSNLLFLFFFLFSLKVWVEIVSYMRGGSFSILLNIII